jgi:hypothetical protein
MFCSVLIMPTSASPRTVGLVPTPWLACGAFSAEAILESCRLVRGGVCFFFVRTEWRNGGEGDLIWDDELSRYLD